MKNRPPITFLCLSLATVFAAGSADALAQDEASATVTYDQVRPVFRKHCVTCHNQERARGDLDLSTVGGIKAGSASGVAAVANKPDESLIYLLAAHLETPKMPPNSPKMPQRELDLMRRWIEGGMIERGDPVAKPESNSPKPSTKPSAVVAAAPKAAAMTPIAGVAIEPLPRATPITALAASPTTPLVAVSGRKQVALFQWTDREPLKAFPFPDGDVFALRFSRDGEILLAGGGIGGLSGKVVGYEVATGKTLFELGDETDVVLALDISPDKSLVALGGPGRSVKVFRTATGELVATLRKHTDWILSLAFSPEGLLLASGDRFGGLQVWEAQSGKEFHTLRGHVGAVTAVAWSADSERLLSAGLDGSLRYWDMHEGAVAARWDGGVGGVLAVEATAAGQILSGGRNRKLAVWDKPDVAGRAMSMPDEVVKLAISHDSTHVIAGDAAGHIEIFSLANGDLAGRFALPLATTPTASQAVFRPKPAAAPARSDSPLHLELAAAEAESRKAAAEAAQVREALTLAEAAVKSADESLGKLRESAVKLAAVAAGRDAAAKQVAQRVADLRARLDAEAKAEGAGPAELRAQRERVQQRLTEKRSLLDATAAVSERITGAAAQAPGDSNLAAAAKLAVELRNNLSRDVEATTAELRRIDESSSTARK